MGAITYFKIFEDSYKELNNGDTINIKKEKGDGIHFVVTINKGRKEFLLPVEKINALQFIQGKELSKESIFINGEDYTRVKWVLNKPIKLTDSEILVQLTDFGQSLYLLNKYGKEIVDTFKNML